MRDLSKLNTLLNSANSLEILQIKAIRRSCNKECMNKISKILAENNVVFNF